MTDKFLPPPEQLPPVARLVKLTQLRKQDLEETRQAWRDKPPDGKYKLILEAEAKEFI